jgi:hypothetical protein
VSVAQTSLNMQNHTSTTQDDGLSTETQLYTHQTTTVTVKLTANTNES